MEDRYNQFTTLISQIYRSLLKIKSGEMKIRGLKSIHVSCLYYLYVNDGKLTAKELVNACKEDKGAISRAIELLKIQGYIEYENEGKKAYNTPIILTNNGIEVGKYIFNKIDQLLDKVSYGVDEKQRENLYASLKIIANNLESISSQYENKKIK